MEGIDSLSVKLNGLNTKVLGRNVAFYDEIDSTQKEVFRRIEDGTIRNGTLIIADRQSQAVGTHGRVWHTDISNNIAFSLFVKVEAQVQKLEGLTTDLATDFIDIFKQLYGIKLELKLPNDIVYKSKKIGGILTQSKIQGDLVRYLVIGIGINTNQMPLSEDVADIASSIKKEFGINVENSKVIVEFCNYFEQELERKGIGIV